MAFRTKKRGGPSQSKAWRSRAAAGFKGIVLAAVAGLIAPNLGCSPSTDCNEVYRFSPWLNEAGVKRQLSSYKHVLEVRVTGSRGEDRGALRLGILHFQGTVVKVYKGDWKVSDRIALAHHVDYQPKAAESTQSVGNNFLVFINQHTNAEIVFETGEFMNYDPGLDRALECALGRRGLK